MTRATIDSIAPFFIVASVARAITFYREQPGFEVTVQEPRDDPFFAIVARDGAMLFFKGSGDPLPNPRRYAWARWDG